VALGLKPGGRPEAPLRPVLREFEIETGKILRELWLDARHCASPSEHQVFTVGYVAGRTLIQPTRTEILSFDLDTWTIQSAVSHPLFYDLHSVTPTPRGTQWVTATGHDSVLEVAGDRVLRHVFLRSSDFEVCFPGISDFRREPFARFKPHVIHPNYAIEIDGQPWVTAMNERAFRTADGSDRVEIAEGMPHDGRRIGERLWLTTVNGHVIVLDAATRTRQKHFFVGDASPSGWWRGIDVSGDRCFVGRSALRPSRWNEIFQRFTGRDVDRARCEVVVVSADDGRLLHRIEAGNDAGGQIYAIYTVS
jgi:hypothetical protein